jgi:hypothetical protein
VGTSIVRRLSHRDEFFMIPRSQPLPHQLENGQGGRRMTTTEQTSSVRSKDGTEIAFDRRGDGPALILVGAALQTRRGVGSEDLAELLAGRFTVYTYDRRGRGESGDTPPYAVEREIEDLDAVVAEAGGSAYAVGDRPAGLSPWTPPVAGWP